MLIVAGILIAVLVKVIKNGECKKEEPEADAYAAAADDQIKPKE